MNMSARHFLPNSFPITETFLKARVADIIGRIQREHEYNDRKLAERVYCSTETITNARNGDNKLSAHTLFNMLLVSPTALEGLLHHFDRRSVPLGAKCDTDAMPSTAAVMHKLAVASHDGRISDRECLEMEATLDAAIEALSGIKSRCLSIREQRA